jgi:hypothetical protein
VQLTDERSFLDRKRPGDGSDQAMCQIRARRTGDQRAKAGTSGESDAKDAVRTPPRSSSLVRPPLAVWGTQGAQDSVKRRQPAADDVSRNTGLVSGRSPSPQVTGESVLVPLQRLTRGLGYQLGDDGRGQRRMSIDAGGLFRQLSPAAGAATDGRWFLRDEGIKVSSARRRWRLLDVPP